MQYDRALLVITDRYNNLNGLLDYLLMLLLARGYITGVRVNKGQATILFRSLAMVRLQLRGFPVIMILITIFRVATLALNESDCNGGQRRGYCGVSRVRGCVGQAA